MQTVYPEEFEREMACTEGEWLRMLPASLGNLPFELDQGHARVCVANGHLTLSWRRQPELRIALLKLPRLHVRFLFSSVSDEQRFAFMQRFDLYTHRGGG